MDESEENLSAEDTHNDDSPSSVKIKPKKRSLVERELETNLTARVTSPVTSEGSNTSRYGRARRLKTTADADAEKIMKPLKIDVSKQAQAYKMYASNSPIRKESPKRTISVGSNIDDQIENIYNENIALSRFGTEEKAMLQSPVKKFSKVYIRKDLIQKPDTDTVVLIKNMFSPNKPNSHLNNILERSSEKYALNGHGNAWNGFPDTSSVVKTLDFDDKKKKKDDEKKKEKTVSKTELFDLEASCEYQVGDLAWARVGTYPFWPCIVTREPFCDMFVKKKLFGRVERFVIHVTFFGDRGRRGWIVDNMLCKYHGKAEFESYRDKFTLEAKKKDPRFYAAHFVSEKKLPLWNVSVDEAETLIKEPKRLRIDILYDMLEKARASKTTPKREKGGKISRTDSDVSLSESLYDTLFSEDDGKTDDSKRSKRVRKKSLDVSEVVTACLDNMAAKSGIIQIQRQSHMDRWLQKAKSKTPEKMQPKLNVKVEREKRKDKVKKKSKEGKKIHKVRKHESLGSDANLLPYQNEHDYSSVNYENHNINDSSNKNTDSASGHDSALDSSDIGVVVKIENISSSMEDLSQDDIITTVVNDDIIMTDPENISNDNEQNEINHEDDINDTADNSNEHSLANTKSNDNEQIATKEEVPLSNCDLTTTVQPRRSKRKRQTFEGLNNSITENKAKEPKLDLTEPTNINNTSTPDRKPEVNTTQENTTMENTEIECNEPTISKPEIDTITHNKPKLIEFTTSNSNSKPVVVIELLNLKGNKDSDSTENTEIECNEPTISKPEIETTTDSRPKSIEFTTFNSNSKPVVVIELLNLKGNEDSDSTENTDIECIEPTISKPEIEATTHNKPKSIEFTTFNTNSKPVVVIEPLNLKGNKDTDSTENTEIECNEPTISKPEIETTTDSTPTSIEFTTFNSNSKPVVVIEPLNLNGLETQLIIKGSKFYRNDLQTKSLDSTFKDDINTKDKLKTPDVVQSNSNCAILKDADNSLQKSSADENRGKNVNTKPDSDTDTPTGVVPKLAQDVIAKHGHQQTEEGVNNSEGMEVNNCATHVIVGEKNNIVNKTDTKMAVSLETDTSDVFKDPLVQKEETINKKTVTNVVIGEETYIFDRTLSQDYDEIDAGECDTVSDLPDASSNNEDEDASAIGSALNGQEETSSPDSCMVNIKTSDLKTLEVKDKSSDLKSTDEIITLKVDDLSTNDDYGSVNKPTSDVNMANVPEDVHRNSIFLDKESIQNESYTSVPIEDNRPTVASDVSSIMSDKLNEVSNNQVTEENNAKCVFLDQSLVIENAQSAENLEKKRKSPRLSLNRTRHSSLKLNKLVNDLPIVDNNHKVNTDPEKRVIETALTNSNGSEISITKRTGRSKEKVDSKKGINDPEFIKYLEIRQDALLDDQPDLTQDEIVTYLYQNWLYEEENKSDVKKIDDNEQSNLVKGFNQEPVPQRMKIKRKPKVENAPELKNVDIRDMMMHKEKLKPAPEESKSQRKPFKNDVNRHTFPDQDKTPSDIVENNTQESKEILTISVNKLQKIEYTRSSETCKTHTDDYNFKENNVSLQSAACSNDILTESKSETDSKAKIPVIEDPALFQNVTRPVVELSSLKENGSCAQENMESDPSSTDTEGVNLKETNDIDNEEFDETCTGKLEESDEEGDKDSKEPVLSKINGIIESEKGSSKTNDLFDPETATIKSEDSRVPVTTRKGRNQRQDAKKSTEDPEFVKYLEARQDALIDEQPDLTQEELVTYLYQTWFYEESQKSDVMKTDETEPSNLVKGLNQEPVPQPRKYKKKPQVEKETKIEKEPVKKVLKNADIRDMVQKPKRKATQSTPYYNEEDSDLEEDDLETFKIFDRDEQNEEGEVIDEVELYFEQLTKPKPNVFKGYARERVCEICDCAGNLVKCKSCHGTFHVDCVKNESEIIEVAAPTRGRKKKRGRKPKNYDPLLDSGSQSDERSQDANNSEELNISIEDEAESHIVIDADNFETQWENKLKELQTENQDDYASDQEINWEVEPGHCEIVDLKHKEKPIDYSDYKCNNCLKHDTPVCFVCKSDKSPKAQIEVRQKCQVAHCHRYYHLECLDLWPQTQFHSWEPSKTNKKVIEYIEALSCPRHVCHTCVSDDPRGCKTRFCGDKLARCVKCPATYHSYTKCLPAGTQILTGSQIICPRHYEHRPGKVPCHVNTGWCFICALGGTLICCEYCPTSFHAECLNIKPPEGSYMCEDCETGRLPLYGEMVWVKLGHYRWWPGIVLHPTEIPDNIMAVKHSPGEFVVRFFGQYDHYWVNRGRVFPFQEGDSGRISSQKSKIDAAFTTAMEHAQRACEILKKMQPNQEEDLDIASSLLPPHYVKLKVNKPVGGVARRDMDANSLTQCDCEPAQPDPCGPYSHCLNRMLLTECGPLCRAGDRCNNRAFERRLYPRLQAYRTPHRGWGLRTLDDIKQGQFVIEYVGELIDLDEFRRRMCRKHEIRDENFYFLTLDKERMIDAGPKGNLARFMNHCCEPNCETQKWTVLGDVRVGLFALRDIPANSEVTFNYNLECAGIEKKRCLCGAKRCSGYIGAKPKQLQDDQPKKTKPVAKRTYKKRKPVEDTSKLKIPKIKIKPIKPRELTEIEKDLLIIKNATNGMSSDSDGSRVSVEDKNPKALKRKRVSFSTDDGVAKKAKMADGEEAV